MKEKKKIQMDIVTAFYLNINSLVYFTSYAIANYFKGTPKESMTYLVFCILFLIMGLGLIVYEVKNKFFIKNVGKFGFGIFVFLQFAICFAYYLLYTKYLIL